MKIKHILTAIALPLSLMVLANDPTTAADGNYSSSADYTAQTNAVGKTVTFKIPNQHPGKAFLLKSATPSNNWLFVYHDRWGLNNDVKQEAYTLWKDLKNVNVMAIDLYDGKVAKNSGQAMRFLMSSEYNRNVSIIKGAIAYVGQDAKIASIGWSTGGAWSLQTAIHAGEQDVACVVYYGMPEYDVNKLKQIDTDVFAIYADMDTWVTPGLANTFEQKMQEAGKTLQTVAYKGEGGFAKRNSEEYDFDQAKDAYYKVLNYLIPRFN